MSASVVRTGTVVTPGCPEIGQVPSPTTARITTSARSVQEIFAGPPAGRFTKIGSSTVSAAMTPMRTRCAAPNWLLNTSRRSSAPAPNRPVPAW